MEEQAVAVDRESLQKRPGIFIVGCPNVGKRTLLSRLLSLDFEDASDSSSDVLAYGWTINTKYYMADVSLWMADLSDEFSIGPLPMFDQLAALVMVYNMSDLSSFLALKDWVSRTDIQKFDILLCIGNKVDLLPDHPAHVEYKRRMQKLGESWSDPHPEFSEYGINETEGSSLLGDEEPSMEIKSSCVEWCCEHNIEYIEACASNADFDKCTDQCGCTLGAAEWAPGAGKPVSYFRFKCFNFGCVLDMHRVILCRSEREDAKNKKKEMESLSMSHYLSDGSDFLLDQALCR
ncbi:hypothetical protein RJ640_027775 [Escallonia rubra]|uniref:Uncharacterized protein n=1 Tax=Escallonia rubra TaxID=112253 RepID=A0AA88UJ57_9ASTE|nr:hypothetical protein RJ640_027775 [Escallonia rubra]